MRRATLISLIIVFISLGVLNIGCNSPVTPIQATIIPGATTLEFTVQPIGAKALSLLGTQPVVIIEDAFGNVVIDSTAEVTLSIVGGPPGAIIYGETKLKAVNGIANFTNLSIDLAGLYYTLIATSSGLSSASSEMFNISAR